MHPRDIIRAWKDELFRKNLTSNQQQLLPEHPAGEIVLLETEMETVVGAFSSGQCVGTTETQQIRNIA